MFDLSRKFNLDLEIKTDAKLTAYLTSDLYFGLLIELHDDLNRELINVLI